MKLNEYIRLKQEQADALGEQLVDLVDYKFLQTERSVDKFIYRGSARTIDTFEEIDISNRITSREPISMPETIHDMLNEAFENKFGWKVRNGLFTTSNQEHASIFGKAYLFFPSDTNKWRFVWSRQIDDLNFWIQGRDEIREINSYYYTKNDLSQDIIDFIEDIPNRYIETDLKGALTSGHEVIFDCKKYYLANKRLIMSIRGR